MANQVPHLFDPQSSLEISSGDPATGWTGKFLTTGSGWTKVQNSGIWSAGTWARRHNVVDSGETRDRCLATYNTWGTGLDCGDNDGPGDTLWFYEEMYFPSGFSFAGGSWNNVGINLHHTSGVNGSVGQVPFHFIATNAGGTRHLACQVRGGLQASSSSSGADAPNSEDFLLDSPLQFNHVYRVMVRMTLAPNGTPPSRNQYISVNQPGSYIVPLTTGTSHGIFEIWVDDVLKVSKRRPTSYYDLSMYVRSGYDRNGSGSNPTGQLWYTKMAVGSTREELFSTISPATVDTFEDGADSDSGGGGGGTSSPDTLPGIPGGKVRYGIVTTGQPPGGRTTAGTDRVRASGPITVTDATSIEKLYFHIESATTGTQVYKLAVWDDDGTSGEPLTRRILSQEVSKTGPFNPTWQATTLSSPVTLDPGNYWVGIHSGDTTNIITYAFEDVSGSYRSAADTYSDGSPSTFPANTSDRYKMAIVLEGTVTGGSGGGSEDTTKPTVTSAETQIPFFVALLLDEELDSTNNPDPDAFIVWVNGVNHTPVSTEVTADVVTLTLGDQIAEGVPVTVTYDPDLATNKVIDLAGNQLDGFFDFAVDNSVAPPVYLRNTAYARTIDPSKRPIDPANRIVGLERQVWT